MTKDLSELVEYLDGKFADVDGRFDRGFDAVNTRLIAVETQIVEVKDQVANLYDGVDAYAKKADAYFQEMLMLAHKVDRHEKWLHQIAEKLGVKLKY